MKIRHFFFVIVTCLLTCMACSSDKEKVQTFEDFSELNLGKGTYRPNPFKFCDKIPPFSWIGMPDTVKKETYIEIDFNEDAIRSKAIGELWFVNANGQHITNITFEDSNTSILKIPADNKNKIKKISFAVDPTVGDSILKGYIVVSGTNLDEVNNQKLESSVTPIAQWELTHKIGINWLRWFIFVVIILLILSLLYLLGYLIISVVPEAGIGLEYLSGLTLSFPSFNWKRQSGKNKKKNGKKDKKKNDMVEKLLILEKMLYKRLRIPEKYDILEKMRIIIDQVYETDITTYNEIKTALKSNTWNALEDAWNLWHPTPTNNVEWCGNNARVCKLQNKHPYYVTCKNYNFTECEYDQHGMPDFEKITYPGSVVDISDLYENLTVDQIKKRGGSPNSLQEIAQTRMYNKLKICVDKWAKENQCESNPDKFYKWRDSLDLMPHEDTNCRTMRLVYRSPHYVFKHRGGVANATNIKIHFS